MKKKLYAIVIIWSIFSNSGWSQTITVTGAWNCVVSYLDLQSGPGSNLNSIFTSTADAAYIDVSAFPFFLNWRVQVNMRAITWNPNLQIWAHRTGNGSSWFGTISGGTTYQQVTDIAQTFYSGSLNRTGVPVQYQIRNVSAAIPSNSYSVEIVYTLEGQ